jgi:hypothetical protein
MRCDVRQRIKRHSGLLCGLLACAAAAWVVSTGFSGTVSDMDDTDPIWGADITVGNAGWPPASTIYTTTTDMTGFYDVSGMSAASDYTVLASAIGYVSQDMVMQEPPATLPFSLTVPAAGMLVDTVNEGVREYSLEGACSSREDGVVQEQASFFPEIEASSPTITAFLTQIVSDTTPSEVDAVIWQKAKDTWEWLQANAAYSPGDPTYDAAMEFLMADGWPSIQRMADTFATYGILPWGTCMSRAQAFTTLLYRVGISKDRLAIAETRWQLRYSQHMYTILYLTQRWLHLDPIHIHVAMPGYTGFGSVPRGGYSTWDYRHPRGIKVIPGANLSSVPEVTDRSSNSPDVFIRWPPDLSHTLDSVTPVSGVSSNPAVDEVLVNGALHAVVAGEFAATVELACGQNHIVAQVDVAGHPVSDSVALQRWCVDSPSVTVSLKPPADVLLAWLENVNSCGYEVHRSPAPYTVPGTATLVQRLPSGTTSYLDLGAAGDVGKNYFYTVGAVLCGGRLSSVSNETAEFDFAVAPGS